MTRRDLVGLAVAAVLLPYALAWLVLYGWAAGR